MKKSLCLLLMFTIVFSAIPNHARAASEPVRLQDLVQYVNPLIGSNNFKGNSEFAGLAPFVTSPFGMTNFTPQTRQNSIGGISYLYTDKQFKGFFATHQPAIWMGDYGYVNVMPQIGEIKPSEADRALTFDYKNNDSSKPSNKEEISTPYYYQAKMGSSVGKPITAEMTATERSAIYRFKFPQNNKSSILVEAARNRGNGSVTVDVNSNEIYGWNNDNMSAHLNNNPPKNLKGYFVIQFSKPISVKGTYKDYVPTGDGTTTEGQKSGGYVTFNTAADEVIEVKIGTSFISVDQARKNIAQEIGTKSFDTVKEELKQSWNKKLNTIQIEGATEDEKFIFYTAMFHALMYPRMFYENVDGTNKYYSPYDDQIHEGKSYTDFSMWDTFRAQNSFLTLVAPERIDEMVQSLLQNYQQGGYMPKWPNPYYTNIMIGTHADSIVAEAINKGFKGFDYNLAYEAVYKDAMVPQKGDGSIKWQDRQQNVPYEARAGLSAYKELGFIPNGYVKENVSNTIEGAYDDWAVAQVAKAVGKMNDYIYFLNRSQNYKNAISPSTGYAMGRDVDGNWSTDGEEFTEGDRRKYTWFAPHDPQGLLDYMTKYKGADFYNVELAKAYGQGGTAWIEHQNEPGHHYAYMFDFSGRPDLTQKFARKTLVESYFNDTSGMLGNDDCGQMSAWYIFSAMGFYPVNPASGEYMIGSPIFDKVTINNPMTGTKFVITAPNNDGPNFYIKSAKLNGNDHNIPQVTYDQITSGGTLHFEMSSTATDWAKNYAKPALTIDESAQNPEPESDFMLFGSSVVNRVAKTNITAGAKVRASTFQVPSNAVDLGDPDTSLTDGNYSFGYMSGDLTAASLAQTPYYISMEWDKPKDALNTFAIYSNYATSQGPKKVDIEVRHPGGDWTPIVTDYIMKWNNDKDTIDLGNQSNVDGLRIRVKEAYLSWGHIALRELEVFKNLPTVIDLNNPSDYVAEITYNTNQLTDVALNGRKLVKGVDYTIAGAKNNIVTIDKSVFVRNGAEAAAKLTFNFSKGAPSIDRVNIVDTWIQHLKSLAAKATGIDNKRYTAASMAAVNDELKKAQTVLDQEAPSDNDLKLASNALETAIRNLTSVYVKATDYTAMSGIQLDNSNDIGGGKVVGWIDSGDWLEYKEIDIPMTGNYILEYRVAVNGGKTGEVSLVVDGVPQRTTRLPSTGGYQNWTSVFDKISLAAGKHTIRLQLNADGWNFNWFKLSALDSALVSITTPEAITGLANGTEKTAEALGLPSTVPMVTDAGSLNAAVTWDVYGSSYDPAAKTVQTFTVNGTVTLPEGVDNPNNVSLTTSIQVTVLQSSTMPQSTLTGAQQVAPGQTFAVTMGLSSVTQSVYQQMYAQDLTLHYDPANVKFDSVTSLRDGFEVIDQKETVPGQIRIVAASVGADQGVPAQGDMLKFKFTVKSDTKATDSTVSVGDVVIANGEGNELQVNGVSHKLQISTTVDKSLLNASIASAQTKHDAAVEGNGHGLYAVGSKAQLQSTINAAKATANDPNATQQQVDSAKSTLEAAVQVFESKKISADVNGKDGITIGDLAIVAAAYGKQDGQSGWNAKADVNHDGKVDIEDLAIVAKAILQ